MSAMQHASVSIIICPGRTGIGDIAGSSRLIEYGNLPSLTGQGMAKPFQRVTAATSRNFKFLICPGIPR